MAASSAYTQFFENIAPLSIAEFNTLRGLVQASTPYGEARSPCFFHAAAATINKEHSRTGGNRLMALHIESIMQACDLDAERLLAPRDYAFPLTEQQANCVAMPFVDKCLLCSSRRLDVRQALHHPFFYPAHSTPQQGTAYVKVRNFGGAPSPLGH